MTIAEISGVLKEGLKKGYKQNLLLLSSYSEYIDEIREYLLTVNVAQQLLEWNDTHTCKVQIEYPVLYFYNNAFPSYIWDATDIFSMGVISRQSGHSPTDKRYQKIDLAITQEQMGGNASTHERTLVGIELKGINIGVADIKKDAERLANAMNLKDPIDTNSIKFSFCGFLRRFDKPEQMVTAKYITAKTQSETQLWNQICTELKAKHIELDFCIDIFDIVNTPLELVTEIHKQMESDYSEVANDTGTVVGGILTIYRK